MKMYYSPKLNGFVLEMHVNAMNAKGVNDLIEIDRESYEEFLAGKWGYFMVPAPAGSYPPMKWEPVPPPSKSSLIERAEFQKQDLMNEARDKIAPLQDAVDLGMATDSEQITLTAWKKYRVLLNRIDCSTAPDIDWPKAPK
ncbi:tail fiber assembly protein [Xenorhabdus bovienii]|uniref:tail fiber assembly protein n=1 Tax=Xenorhabdus bovienii TaxID=40576 RepID=UPI00238C2987|nr:tail fiber assembly protein [Xenorhabdus bovienii]